VRLGLAPPAEEEAGAHRFGDGAGAAPFLFAADGAFQCLLGGDQQLLRLHLEIAQCAFAGRERGATALVGVLEEQPRPQGRQLGALALDLPLQLAVALLGGQRLGTGFARGGEARLPPRLHGRRRLRSFHRGLQFAGLQRLRIALQRARHRGQRRTVIGRRQLRLRLRQVVAHGGPPLPFEADRAAATDDRQQHGGARAGRAAGMTARPLEHPGHRSRGAGPDRLVRPHAPQVVGERFGSRVAAVAIAVHRHLDHGAQVLRDARVQLARIGQVAGEDQVEQLIEGLAVVGPPQRQALEQRDAEAIDVGAAVDAAALRQDLLRRQVGRRAHDLARLRQARALGVDVAREAEVEQYGIARGRHHDVRRLDVAVHQPDFVGGVQRARRALDQLHHVLQFALAARTGERDLGALALRLRLL
jgi:hypothetical protein